MATSNLAPSRHPQLFAGTERHARAICPKPHQFRVFPTGQAEYHWQVAALATNQIISRHKSLKFALKKCACLNEQRVQGVRNDSK